MRHALLSLIFVKGAVYVPGKPSVKLMDGVASGNPDDVRRLRVSPSNQFWIYAAKAVSTKNRHEIRRCRAKFTAIVAY